MRVLGLLRLLCLLLLAVMTSTGKKVVFEAGVKKVDLAGNVYLEDLAEDELSQQSQLEELTLSVSFPNGTLAERKETYKNATANLKRALPALKVLKLHGGYLYNPSKDTSASVSAEITLLKAHLIQVMKAIREAELPIKEFRFVCIYTFTDEALVDVGEDLRVTFHYQPTAKELADKVVDFSEEIEGQNISIKISLGITLLKNSDIGRTRFHDADVHISKSL